MPRWLFGGLLAVVLAGSPVAWAVDVVGPGYVSMDQPRINGLIRLSPDGPPLTEDLTGTNTFRFEAFLDTGASGMLISSQTADLLGVPLEYVEGQPIVFYEVGVGGEQPFNVSQPIYVDLARYHPDLQSTISESDFTQSAPVARAQVGIPPQAGSVENPLLESLDVLGMPVMMGKTVVMDPRPVNDSVALDGLIDDLLGGGGTFDDLFTVMAELSELTMRTYIYDPGTVYQPATELTDPGIPATSLHVALSYASFEDFTRTEPADAPAAATLQHNPFVGPNPLLGGRNDDGTGQAPPAMQFGYQDENTQGSLMLDTGGSVSMISTALASDLGVTYVPGTEETDNPVLAGVPLEDQFTVQIAGVGGTVTATGFFLDTMLLPTVEGGDYLQNPNHIHYERAPVVVFDISAENPDTGEVFILDGILGMNFLSASAELAYLDMGLGEPLPLPANIRAGVFDWLVFDETTGTLGLSLLNPAPGDVNGDGVIDSDDIDALYDRISTGGAYDESYDIDADGDVDTGDVESLVGDVLRTAFADANLDGSVDEADLALFANNWKLNPGQGMYGWADGDFTGDGDVNEADLAYLADRWRYSAGSSAASAVPEPASLALLISAGGMMIRRSRRPTPG